jgi:hypothetical protein
LTLLLSNALSGNSKTSMSGTLSPALANFEESYSTLTFASTVKNIKIKAKPASAVDKDALVKSLQEELQHLKDAWAAWNWKCIFFTEKYFWRGKGKVVSRFLLFGD